MQTNMPPDTWKRTFLFTPTFVTVQRSARSPVPLSTTSAPWPITHVPTAVADGSVTVLGDNDLITQVIYNLLDNAVKFATPGSCLVVKLYKDSGKAYVSVKDYGETIPPDDLPFIFDRFHKSDRSRSLDKDGVGLGLYLVKTILNSHDEDIAVKSEDGMTEFVFTLPLAESTKQRDKNEQHLV